MEDIDKCKKIGIWSKTTDGYIYNSATGIYLHRFLLGVNKKEIEVDHINHDLMDNRKSNLRLATSSQQKMNTKIRSDNTSGHRGVYYDKARNKWAVSVVAGKNHLRKRFDNYEDACQSAEQFYDTYFKEFQYDGKDKKDMYSFTGIDNNYNEISATKFEHIYIIEEDDDKIVEYEYNKIVINKEHKQSIVFAEFVDADDEPKAETCDIIDNLIGVPYAYICNLLNNNDNVTVYISCVPDTTADFIVIHNQFLDSNDKLEKYLETHPNLHSNMKYVEYIDDFCKVCNL